MIKACIFDLDGTLTNSLPSIAYFVNETIKKYGMEEIPLDNFRLFVGNGTKKLIDRVLKYHQKNDLKLKEKILKEYTHSYDANPIHLCEIYDGIKELLKCLKKKNIKLAVLSNKQQIATEKIINILFGKNEFSCVLGGRDGIPLKPDPTAVYEIIEKFNFKKEECLFVGDTYVDIETGKNAGLKSIGVLWGFRDRAELEKAKADFIIKKPIEILNFID